MQLKYALPPLFFLASCILVACGGGNSAPKLEPPSDLRVSPDAGFVKLSWTDNSDNETGFIIYREEASAGTTLQALAKIDEVDANIESFQDDDVEAEKAYRYAVAAFNAAGPTEQVEQSGPAVSPEPPIVNNIPFIAFFFASPEKGNPPFEATFSWSISDSDADVLRCELDIGNNGQTNYTIDSCSSADSQTHTFNQAGTTEVKLTVSDGKDATEEILEVEVIASLR